MKNLSDIFKEYFYIGEHANCDESCSKKWYEENDMREATQDIKDLFKELMIEVVGGDESLQMIADVYPKYHEETIKRTSRNQLRQEQLARLDKVLKRLEEQ